MPVQLQIRLNGGAPQTGGVTGAIGNAVQLTAANKSTWNGAARWEIYDYPPSFTVPSGWTADGDGVFYALGNSDPPAFTISGSTNWGKYGFRVTVLDGAVLTTDDATALSIPSAGGIEDIMAGESSQFGGPRQGWVGPFKQAVRILEVGAPSTAAATPSRTALRDSQGRLAAASFLGAGGIPVERTVRAFGATGNGVADDTAALQAAIDSLPNNGGILRIPAGDYVITDTLVIDDDGTDDPGRRGLTLRGDGGGSSGQATVRIWCGFTDDTRPMMRIRSRDTIVEGIQFIVPHAREALCAIDYDSPAGIGGQSPTNHTLRRCSTYQGGSGYFVHAVRLGATNPANLENFAVEECNFGGFTDYGFYILSSSGQSKHHQIYKCGFAGGKRHIMQVAGSFQSWGCDFQSASEAAVWISQPGDHIVVGDFMSENCDRLLVAGTLAGGAGSGTGPVSLIGGRAAPNSMNADGRFVVMNLTGPFYMQGCIFDRESDHADFKIQVGNNSRTVAHFTSCAFPSGTRDVIEGIAGTTARVTIESCTGDGGAGRVDIADQRYEISATGTKSKLYEMGAGTFAAFGGTPTTRPVVAGARTDALAASLVDAMGVLGWVQNATRTPLQIFGSDLFIWYTFDAANCTIADTDRIGQVNDLSGNARHATAATTKRPTTTTLADGREAAQFQFAEDRHMVLPGAASAYTWMHNGVSGMFAAFCIQIPTGENTARPLLDNVRGSSAVNGVLMRAALTAGVGCDAFIMNAGGGGGHLSNAGAIATGPTADTPLVVWNAYKADRSPLLSTEVFGTTQVRTDNTASGSPAVGNPNWPPSLGNYANGGAASQAFAGKMRHVVLVQRLPTADEQEALLHWMNTV